MLYKLYNWNIKLIALVVIATASLYGMEMPKTPKTREEQFIGAAAHGNLNKVKEWLAKGVNINARYPYKKDDKKSGQTALIAAARSAHAQVVNFLLDKGANTEIADVSGLTPVAWAAIQLNRGAPDAQSNYLNIIGALKVNGANLRSKDINGITVLHHAAAAGDPTIIQYLHDKGAWNDINEPGSKDKGRTPIAEAVRASQDAIVHVQEFEDKDFASPAALETALNKAIEALHKKVEKKLSTEQIIATVSLLKDLGANSQVVDALGNTLDYYINEVQLISEPERKGLLKALGLPEGHRIIHYTENDLPEAKWLLKVLDGLLQQYKVGNKVDIIIWTIQAAEKEHDPKSKYDILRLAMALISKLKEQTKEKVQDLEYFKDIEDRINKIRVILRDAALVISRKVSLKDVKPIHAPVATPVPSPVKKLQPAVQPSTPFQLTTPPPRPTAPAPAWPEKSTRPAGVLPTTQIEPVTSAPRPVMPAQKWIAPQIVSAEVPKQIAPMPVKSTGIKISDIENQSDAKVMLSISHGSSRETLRPFQDLEIFAGKPGKPFVKTIDLTLDPRMGMANLTIISKKGFVNVEVTDGLQLSSATGIKQLSKSTFERSRIFIYPDGRIELVPVSP